MSEQGQPSSVTPPPSRRPMQLVGEATTADPQTLSSLIGASQTKTTPETTTTPSGGEYVHRAAWKAGVLGSLNVLFVILAIRAILMVAVVGAIYLAIIATTSPDPWRLAAVAGYAIIVVVPLTWLAARK